LRLPDFMIVGT